MSKNSAQVRHCKVNLLMNLNLLHAFKLFGFAIKITMKLLLDHT